MVGGQGHRDKGDSLLSTLPSTFFASEDGSVSTFQMETMRLSAHRLRRYHSTGQFLAAANPLCPQDRRQSQNFVPFQISKKDKSFNYEYSGGMKHD